MTELTAPVTKYGTFETIRVVTIDEDDLLNIIGTFLNERPSANVNDAADLVRRIVAVSERDESLAKAFGPPVLGDTWRKA